MWPDVQTSIPTPLCLGSHKKVCQKPDHCNLLQIRNYLITKVLNKLKIIQNRHAILAVILKSEVGINHKITL